jgi:predicted ATPase
MITAIEINGFKSFHNFEMDFLTPYTIIAGVNASGKSNLFDAIKLLSKLADSKLKDAFKDQRGDFLEIFTKYDNGDFAKKIEFAVEMLVNKTVTGAWGTECPIKYTRLRYEISILCNIDESSGLIDFSIVNERLETIKPKKDKWIRIIPTKLRAVWRPPINGARHDPYIFTGEVNGILTVTVPQDGTGGKSRSYPLHNSSRTVLSSFDDVDFPHILAAREEMKSWRYLQFNPEDLREPTDKYKGEDIISHSGKNLAATLYRIKQKNPYALVEISRELNRFLPNFVEVDAIDDVPNKQYLINLTDESGKVFSSRVLSEGTLRVLALLIMGWDDRYIGTLCFEEPENGIHPFRIGDMATLLKKLSSDFSNPETPLRQIIVNTHSPVMVGEVYRWTCDDNVSLWYSKITTRIADVEGVRTKMNITKFVPVLKEYEKPKQSIQMTLFGDSVAQKYDDSEIKTTLNTVQKYLQSS